MGHEDWQQQLEAERYEIAVRAINNCAKAGADIESLRVLAMEAGIDITHTVLGDQIKVKGQV